MIKKSITNPQLIDHLDKIYPDEMSVFVMADGMYRGALLNGTMLVNQMRAQHDLGILESFILGNACLASGLLLQTMKGREHLTLRYETDGLCKGFSTSVDSTGFVRAYLFDKSIPLEKPLESWDTSQFFGNGTLTLSRFPEGAKEAQTGSVEIVKKNIAQDLTWYFLQSEQINTAFNTSLQFSKDGLVTGAGGLFLQAMPGADEETTERVEHAFSACPSLGQWFSEQGDTEDIIYGLFREFNPSVALTRKVIYDCPCSKEKFASHINALNSKQFSEIMNGDFPLEVICEYCSSKYQIEKKDLLN